MSKHFNLTVDADGIALITMDSPGRSMNVLGPDVEAELAAIVDKVVADATIRGAIITSGKPSFLAGYDLTEFLRSFGPQLTPVQVYENFTGLGRLLRRIETCGKPFAAAINGLALGGGLELCLACHYRVIADDPKAFVGLPEVKVGLLPGAGGTQRVPRLMDTQSALQMLLKGDSVPAQRAKMMNLVHEVAPAGEIVARAKAWIMGGGKAVAKITAQYPSSSAQFVWNVKSGGYDVRLNGSPARATEGGTHRATTVVVQYVKQYDSGVGDKVGGLTPKEETVGTGKGCAFRNGKAYKITWSRPDKKSPTTFAGADGQPVAFAPGQVWVVLVNRTKPISMA